MLPCEAVFYLLLPFVQLSLPIVQIRFGLVGPLEEGESGPLFITRSRRCSVSLIFWKADGDGLLLHRGVACREESFPVAFAPCYLMKNINCWKIKKILTS